MGQPIDTRPAPRLRHGLARIAALPLLLLIAGCGLPPAVVATSYGVELFALMTTGKTFTDHAISGVLGRDCALLRVVEGEPVCIDFADAIVPPAAVATLPTGTHWSVQELYE